MAELKTIYVIDDDTALRTAYAAALTRLGYDVQTAPDGQEGLKLLAAKKPDLILIDLLMPNLDGMGFIEKLREDSANSEVKVVVASNIESMPGVDQLTINKYLVKTEHSPEELAAIVDTVAKA